jgi:hypothetical protein
MVKYASRKHLLIFWKVSKNYILMYWIHEYYLSQWSTIISYLTSLHNMKKKKFWYAFKFFFYKCKYRKYMLQLCKIELQVHENKT